MHFIKTTVLAACLCWGASLHAGGYAIGQESVSGAGEAHAGGAAGSDDASTVYSNPASMTLAPTAQATFGLSVLVPRIDYDERASVVASGGAVTGGEGGNGGQAAAIPNLYIQSAPYGRWRFGLGINSPFGLVTKYDHDWLGRYSEVTTSLQTVNLNPAVAAQVTSRLSIGVGLNLQRVRPKLLQAIDFGSNCVANLGATTCDDTFGLAPQNSDGSAYVSGWDWGFGYNVGALFEFTPFTRMGVHYRSQVHYTIDIDADFDVPTAVRNFLSAAGSPNAFTDGQGVMQITIPEQLSVSLQHRFNERWKMKGDVTWTRWSQFEQLRIDFAEPTTPANVLRTRWNDVLRVSAGVNYQWNSRVLLRAGLAYDESPIDTANRGPGVPDSDRYVTALGARYQIDDDLSVDVAYQHLFFATSNTQRVSTTNSLLVGSFDVDVDVASVGINWRF